VRTNPAHIKIKLTKNNSVLEKITRYLSAQPPLACLKPLAFLHLLFFSSLSLLKSIREVDWAYLKSALVWIIPPTLVGENQAD
jgi:hypothetical protein